MNMLKANNLIIGYKGHEVAGPLSFDFPDGQSVMLCGSNGSGKSTLMRTLAGPSQSKGISWPEERS